MVGFSHHRFFSSFQGSALERRKKEALTEARELLIKNFELDIFIRQIHLLQLSRFSRPL